MEKEIVIESDSENAFSRITRKEECPWSFRFYCNKLKNILLLLKGVSFEHRCRETNTLADSLAKEGSYREGTWLIWT